MQVDGLSLLVALPSLLDSRCCWKKEHSSGKSGSCSLACTRRIASIQGHQPAASNQRAVVVSTVQHKHHHATAGMLPPMQCSGHSCRWLGAWLPTWMPY